MIRLILAALKGVAVAIVTLAALFQPDCPTEDSCTADYHDGAWHITEVTP